MAYTLSNGSTTVQLNTTGDTNYGSPQIQEMKVHKESQIWTIPIPASDSNATIIIDLLGTTKKITLSGVLAGTTTQIDNFINAIEGFQNSNQFNLSGNGLTFAADRPSGTSITVILIAFDWTYDAGVPNKLNWTLDMQQGNS